MNAYKSPISRQRGECPIAGRYGRRRGFVMGRSVWAAGEYRDEFPAAADAELVEYGA
jgi:hypothetical protein